MGTTESLFRRCQGSGTKLGTSKGLKGIGEENKEHCIFQFFSKKVLTSRKVQELKIEGLENIRPQKVNLQF